MKILSISATTHGRVLVEDAAASVSRGLLVGFHGYGQNAEDALGELRQIPGAASWTLVAVQALHRFYARDNQRVIASWMTREDRELAIADNVAYVDGVVKAIRVQGVRGRPGENSEDLDRGVPGVFHRSTSDPIVLIGFSQGASMAYRAGVLGAHRAAGIVGLAGDIPPEIKTPDAASRTWPPVLLATGARDTWFTPARLEADAAFLASRGVPHETLVVDGGHEWTADVRQAVGGWLERLIS